MSSRTYKELRDRHNELVFREEIYLELTRHLNTFLPPGKKNGLQTVDKVVVPDMSIEDVQTDLFVKIKEIQQEIESLNSSTIVVTHNQDSAPKTPLNGEENERSRGNPRRNGKSAQKNVPTGGEEAPTGGGADRKTNEPSPGNVKG